MSNVGGDTQPSANSFFQKLNVGNSCQKTRKIRYCIFEVLFNFTVFLYSVPNILARIDCLRKQIFDHNLVQSPSNLNFSIYSVISKFFSNHDVNIKQVSCVKSSKCNDFVLTLFFIHGLGQSLNFENFQLCRLVVFWTN